MTDFEPDEDEESGCQDEATREDEAIFIFSGGPMAPGERNFGDEERNGGKSNCDDHPYARQRGPCQTTLGRAIWGYLECPPKMLDPRRFGAHLMEVRVTCSVQHPGGLPAPALLG